MKDSAPPDGFNEGPPDGFVEKKKIPAVVLPGPAPVSSAPAPGVPSPTELVPPPGVAVEPNAPAMNSVKVAESNFFGGATMKTSMEPSLVVPGHSQALPEKFQPSESDITNILSMVKPEERDIARNVLQRDVRTREDLDLLQGKLSEFGKQHGFGFAANLIEYTLNPMTIPELAVASGVGQLGKEIAGKVLGRIISPERLKQVLSAVDFFTPESPFSGYADKLAARSSAAVADGVALHDIPTSPTEIVSELAIKEKKQAIMGQLVLPEEIGNATPSDPMGTLKKRLALPGEDGEVVQMPRITPTDPQGILPPKTYRVVPVNKPIPDELITDVTPEGIRNIVMTENPAIEESVLRAAKDKTPPVSETKSQKASKKTVDMIRSQVMTDGEDLALYANTQKATEVERELFGDPQMALDATSKIPLTKKQVYLQYAKSVYTQATDMLKNIPGAGEYLSKLADEAITVSDARAGRTIAILNEAYSPIKGNQIMNDNLIAVLEGKALPLNAEVKKAAIITRAIQDKFVSEADTLGETSLFPKGARTNYFPHNYDLDLLRQEGPEGLEAVRNLMKTQKMRWAEASDVVENLVGELPKLKREEALSRISKDLSLSPDKAEKFLNSSLAQGNSSRENILKAIMEQTGMTRQKAVVALDSRIKNSVKRFGPLEFTRDTHLPGYSKDFLGVMSKYLVGGYRRLEMARVMGSQNEVAGRLVGAIGDAHLRNVADEALQLLTGKTMIGAPSEFAKDAEKAFLGSLTKSYMAISTVSNSFQGVYGAYTRVGLQATADAFLRAFTKSGRAEAEGMGILLDTFSNLFNKEMGVESNFMRKNLFSQVESFNHTVQALAEKSYLGGKLTDIIKNDPTNPFLRRELEYLLLDADKIIKRGALTKDEITKAAIRVTALYQGRFEPAFMPLYASTPLGKILYHLQNFNILWMKSVKDYAWAEVKQGNFAPMSRLLVGGATLGEAQADMWAAISGKPRKEGYDDWHRYLENLSYASSLGLMQGVVDSVLTKNPEKFARVFTPVPLQFITDLGRAGVALEKGKTSQAIGMAGRRLVVPEIVNQVGKVSPVLATGMAIGTRALLERWVKQKSNKENY